MNLDRAQIRCSRPSRNGLSLVELLVAMMAACILLMTVGVTLVQVSAWCRRNRDSVSMQQDGRIAMDMIGRSIRAAAATNVTVAPPSDLWVTLACVTRHVYASGAELVYNPNAAQNVELVSLVGGGRLSSFTVGKTNKNIVVTLSMRTVDNVRTETLKGVFTCRN